MKRRLTWLALALAVAGLSLLILRLLGGGSSGPASLEVSREGPPADSATLVAESVASDEAGRESLAPLPGPEEVAPPLPQLTQRKIIRNAGLDLAVEDVLRSVQEVEDIAAAAGGFVASSSLFSEEPPPEPLVESAQEKEPPERTRTAIITIRVPASEYQAVISRLRGLAKEVRAERSSTSDATEEFADLEARRRNLEATEATYLNLLAKATTIQDILLLQDRINAVRLEIERIQGRINLLNDLSDLATIEVYLTPFLTSETPAPKGWAEKAAEGAWEASEAVLKALGSAGIVAGVVLAWLALPALAGLLVWRFLGPRRPRAGEN